MAGEHLVALLPRHNHDKTNNEAWPQDLSVRQGLLVKLEWRNRSGQALSNQTNQSEMTANKPRADTIARGTVKDGYAAPLVS